MLLVPPRLISTALDPNKLLRKYQGVATKKATLKSLQSLSIDNEQRLNRLERVSISINNDKLAKKVKELQLVHSDAAKQIQVASAQLNHLDAKKLEQVLLPTCRFSPHHSYCTDASQRREKNPTW